ncbi:MAG: hypothetical protein U0R19_13100 [Bryobacteraceae bacterium]
MNFSQTRPPARPSTEAPLNIPNFKPILLHEKIGWKTVSNEAILTGDNLPFVDLPSKLAEMVEKCWKSASVSNPQARSGLQMGNNRQPPAANSWKPEDIFAARKFQERNAPYVKAVAPLMRPVQQNQGLFSDMPLAPPPKLGLVNDWHLMKPLQRISAFTFRGDGRGPRDISIANGFSPPLTRTDDSYVDTVIFPQFESYMQRRFQIRITKAEFRTAFNAHTAGKRGDAPVIRAYFIWRALVEHEALHIPRMVLYEALKGYISTSRAVSVAWEFSSRKNGWVYLTRVRGGYVIPAASEASWVGDYEREHEVAYPGHLPWDEIFAFRKTGSPKFAGPLYLRNGFRESYPTVYEKVIRAFSIS